MEGRGGRGKGSEGKGREGLAPLCEILNTPLSRIVSFPRQ